MFSVTRHPAQPARWLLLLVLSQCLSGCFLFADSDDDDDALDLGLDILVLVFVEDVFLIELEQGATTTFTVSLDVIASNDFTFAMREDIPPELADFSTITRTDTSRNGDEITFSYSFELATDAPLGEFRLTFVGSATDTVNNSMDTSSDTLRVTVVPADVIVNTPAIAAIDTYDDIAAAVDANGQLYLWGENGDLNINGSAIDLARPVAIDGINTVQNVSVGLNFVALLHDDGAVSSFGSNGAGQLGDGSQTDSPVPVSTLGGGVQAISAGALFAMALLDDGTVMGWGSNDSGQSTGDSSTGATTSTPVPIPGLTDITGIATGAFHALALRDDGTVWTWGDNLSGQRGDGSVTGALPAQVPGLINVSRVGATNSTSYAVLMNGTVMAWGSNFRGGIGDGTTMDRPAPVLVSNLTGIREISQSSADSFILATGTVTHVSAWGANFSGQLGSDVGSTSPVPITVPDVPPMVDVEAGRSFSMALQSDGTCGVVWTWGSDGSEQLGDGRTEETSRTQPLPIQGLGAGDCISLTILPNNMGTVSDEGDLDCGNTCADFYAPDSMVTLSATANAGALFLGFTRDCANPDGSRNPGNPLTVVLDQHKVCGVQYAAGNIQMAPTAAFTTNPPSPVNVETTVTFDASSSTDPDGTIDTFAWDFQDDGTVDASGPVVMFTYPSGGTFTSRLRVTDNDGLVDEATAAIVVTAPGQAPQASFTFTPAAPVAVGTPVSFDGSGSTDDGTIVSYEWDFDGDGTFDDSGAMVSFTYNSPGTFNVRLRVTDDDGMTGDNMMAIMVTGPPVASFTFSPASPVLLGTQVDFDGTSSTDDGMIIAYDWDFDGDGINDASGALTSFTYSNGGAFNVRLQVTDNSGAMDESLQALRVNAPPIANFVSNPSPTATINVPVDFFAAASTDDVGIAMYEWDFQDDGTFDAAGETTAFTYMALGPVTIRLRVTDSDGATSETTGMLTVANPQPQVFLIVEFLGTGTGSVTINPGSTVVMPLGDGCDGNFCPAGDFNTGTVLTLTATPTPPSVFAGWDAADCDTINGNDCTLTINNQTTVNPTFN